MAQLRRQELSEKKTGTGMEHSPGTGGDVGGVRVPLGHAGWIAHKPSRHVRVCRRRTCDSGGRLVVCPL
jgi:hypothetical protein